MDLSIRDKIDPATLRHLDGVAQIVAKLYEDGAAAELLGEEPNELREAVYSLGQSYMVLYGILLEDQDINTGILMAAFIEMMDLLLHFLVEQCPGIPMVNVLKVRSHE